MSWIDASDEFNINGDFGSFQALYGFGTIKGIMMQR